MPHCSVCPDHSQALYTHLWQCRVDFKAQEDASSALVQHSLNVFRPPSGSAFSIIRALLVCFPFLV